MKATSFSSSISANLGNSGEAMVEIQAMKKRHQLATLYGPAARNCSQIWARGGAGGRTCAVLSRDRTACIYIALPLRTIWSPRQSLDPTAAERWIQKAPCRHLFAFTIRLSSRGPLPRLAGCCAAASSPGPSFRAACSVSTALAENVSLK